MDNQKFQIGDLVRLNYGHLLWSMDSDGKSKTIEIAPEKAGELAVILYTYNLKYGDPTKPDNHYGVVMLDSGVEWSWMTDCQAELIETNCGFKYISKAKKNRWKDYKYEMINVVIENIGEGWAIESDLKCGSSFDDKTPFFLNKNGSAFLYHLGKIKSANFFESHSAAREEVTPLIYLENFL